MKKTFTRINLTTLVFILIQLSALFGIAQVPGLINYQGIVRDDKGFPVSNQAIALKFEVLQGSATGPVVYTDNQASGVITNAYGLFTTQIGKTSGFGQVNWQQGVSYYLKIWVDPAGGTNLVALGNPQQITSVPYAFHAQTVPATYSNNILSIGNRTFDITPSITSVPNTSITLSGLGTITSAGTNSFDINIPAPTFTNTGQQIITGTYPNFTVNTPTVPASSVPTIAITNNAATTSTVQSSGNSFSINVPPPSFTNTGQNIITGTYPNFTVNTPTVPASSVPTIGISNNAAAGSSVTSSGNSFSINVPPPTFTNAGPATITGAYPNYTVNSPTGTTYTNGTGISITSGSVINNTSPNITPTVAVTTTASGAASVSSLGSSFNINVPPPAFTNVGPATITGTYPNYTINSPVATTYTNGTGISITSGSVINNTSPNITPTVAVTTTASGAASVSSIGSSFNINVPPPVFTNSGQSIVTGTYPSFTVNTPTVAVSSIAVTSTAAAVPAITNSSGSFNINIPTTNAWSILGNTGTSAASNFIGTADNIPLNFRVNNQKSGTIDHLLNNAYFGYQSGLVNAAGNSNAGFGALSLNANTTGNSNAAMGYRALIANTTGNANSAFGTDAMLSNTGGTFNTAAGLNAARGNISGNSNSAFGRDALYSNSAGSSNVALGHQAGYSALGSSNVFIGNTAGYFETGSNKLYISNSTTSVSPLIYGDFTSGQVGINTTITSAILAVDAKSLTSLSGFQMLNARDQVGAAMPLEINAVTNGQIYGTNTYGRILRLNNMTQGAIYDFGIGSTGNLFLTSNGAYTNPAFNITNTGNIGFGTASPNAPLQFANTLVNRKIVLWEGANNDHQYYGFGINGGTLRYQVDATGADHVFFAGTGVAASNELMRIKGNGNVGIGTATPGRKFIVSPDALTISDNTGHTTLYHASGVGNAVFAEGNNSGNSSGVLAYSRAMMAGYNNTSPFGAGNSGLWGIVTGSGSEGYGVIASYGTSYNAPNTYVGLAGRDAGIYYAGIFMGGNVGIGLTNPAFNLQLAANSAAKPTSNVWTVSSDARLKKDVHNYEEGLAEVLKIRPVWFTYTGEAGMPQETGVGIIAQELQQVAPYMVKEWTYTPGAKNTQGSNNQQSAPKSQAGVNYLGVDNGPMTYMLINAVKEQQQQIEDSKKQMEDLKKQIEEQKKLIDILLKK